MVELIRLHPTVSEYLEAEYKMAKNHGRHPKDYY